MPQKYVTNFDVGTENILIRDSNVMHGEGLINVKFPPDNLSPLKGDGSNETTILQNMINYAISENIALFFPEGVYAVDSINVSGKVTFIGSNAIIRKIVSSATPVINATGFLTMRGISVDGNISVLSAAVVGLDVENAGFNITDCCFIGCSDCIHANINTPSSLYNCKFETFNEYGMYLEGSSFIKAFGIFMNVQSNTAKRFMRVDNNNNIIYGLESLSEVSIGVEITGDFNYISARIPNCENPVSDGGQNNNFEIFAQLDKRTYQNVMQTVAEDYAQEVGNFDGNATGHYAFNTTDFILNSSNPLTYKTPVKLNEQFNYVPFKTVTGTVYKVLVEGDLQSGNVANVRDYGATGDGETDDTAAFTAAINSKLPVYVPEGDYKVGEVNPFIIFGEGKLINSALTFNNDFSYCAGLLFENSTGTAIKIVAKNSIIERCIFNNNAHDISLDGVGNKIINCNISNFTDGININNTDNVDSGDNVISNCLMDGGGKTGNAAITLVSGGGLYIVNTKILNCTYGIIESVQTPATSILLVSNSSIESATENAIALVGGVGCFSRVVLSAIEIVGGGINALNVDEMSINNCVIDSVGKNAITLTDCSNVVIEGNVSKYNSAFVNQATVTENLIVRNNNAVNNLKIHGSGNSLVEFVEKITTRTAGLITAPDGNCIIEIQSDTNYCFASFPSLTYFKSDGITVDSSGISGPAGTYSVRYVSL